MGGVRVERTQYRRWGGNKKKEVDGGRLENQNGTIIRRRNVEECETMIRRQGWAHPELHDQEHHHHMRGGIRSSP